MIENEKWGLIAYDTSKNTMMDIAKQCLTATDFPSDHGAHKIGQQVLPGLNQASCCPSSLPALAVRKQEEFVWGPGTRLDW